MTGAAYSQGPLGNWHTPSVATPGVCQFFWVCRGLPYGDAMHPLRRTAVVLLVLAATVLIPSPGDASEGVERAQRRLNALGCDAGPDCCP